MVWVVRFLLFLAAPIAALFVSRDALNFGIVEMLVTIVLITGLALAATAWMWWRKSVAADRSAK
ncbi:hypothetical protein [Bradyrhizobium sp.]|uniref:hypothetical protein n=1 Tax=Bradyrhizobium sp. TaxID=376 RepID=UPI001D3338D0|nr:hypothetical protein [Bradyrhizobium sp.]MBI5318417.1 hypothetical protein [Bradyrhizobium sp.]